MSCICALKNYLVLINGRQKVRGNAVVCFIQEIAELKCGLHGYDFINKILQIYMVFFIFESLQSLHAYAVLIYGISKETLIN